MNQDTPLAGGEKEASSEDDMALRIRAVSDIVFKYIFGTEESVELLKAFVNAVLIDAGYSPVEELQVLLDQNEYFRKAMDRYKYFASDGQARLSCRRDGGIGPSCLEKVGKRSGPRRQASGGCLLVKSIPLVRCILKIPL